MQVKCRQCGAKIAVVEEILFVHCDYCTATFYLDAEGGGQHQVAFPQLKERHAIKIVRQDLHQQGIKEEIDHVDVQTLYAPFWLDRQNRQSEIVPAYQTHVSEFYELNLPGLDYKFFDREQIGDATLIDATLSPEDAYHEAGRDDVIDPDVMDLYHLPYFRVEYRIGLQVGTVWLEAGQGRIIHHSLPSIARQHPFWKELTWIVPFFLLFWAAGLAFDDWAKTIVYAVIGLGIYWFWLPKQV